MKTIFSIDKEKGLEIMKTIFDKLNKKDTEEDTIAIHENMEDYRTEEKNLIGDDEDSEDLDMYYDLRTVIDFRHKIAIVEIDIDYKEDYIGAIKNNLYRKSTNVEIYYGSCIKGDEISIEGYFFDTQYECDESTLDFYYDDYYECFVEKHKNSGYLTILDLSAYV
jgi:hypothetical protein